MEQSSTKYIYPTKPQLNRDARGERPILLRSNFIQIRVRPNFIHQYHISYCPDIPSDSIKTRKVVMRSVYKELKKIYTQCDWRGDSLYATIKLDDVQEFSGKDGDNEYKVKIQPTKNFIDLSDVKEFQKNKSFIENVLKMIFRENDSLVMINRNVFDLSKKQQMNGKDMFVMPGFSTSIMECDIGLLLRVSNKNKFINGKSAKIKIDELKSKFRNGELQRELNEYFRNKSLMANYGSNKVYKCEEINVDFTPINKTINIRKDNETIVMTLEQYYRTYYNKQIQDLNQPLISSSRKKDGIEETIYLIPEFMLICGLDDEDRDEEFNKSFMGKTRLNPDAKLRQMEEVKHLLHKRGNGPRKMKLKDGSVVDGKWPNEVREEWGIEFGNFQEFNGRILNHPQIRFANNNGEIIKNKIRMDKLKDPVNLKERQWCIVSTERNREDANKFREKMMYVCQRLGVRVEAPEMIHGRFNNEDDLIDEIKKCGIEKYQIALIVLDNFSKRWYKRIKRFFYQTIGIPCQVALREKAKMDAYFSNVLNQMVAKLGGTPYTLDLNVREVFYFKLANYDNWYRCFKNGKEE